MAGRSTRSAIVQPRWKTSTTTPGSTFGGGHHGDRLVVMRVELLTLRIDRLHAGNVEGVNELTVGGEHASRIGFSLSAFVSSSAFSRLSTTGSRFSANFSMPNL